MRYIMPHEPVTVCEKCGAAIQYDERDCQYKTYYSIKSYDVESARIIICPNCRNKIMKYGD